MAILAEFMAVTSFMPCVVRDSKVIVPESGVVSVRTGTVLQFNLLIQLAFVIGSVDVGALHVLGRVEGSAGRIGASTSMQRFIGANSLRVLLPS